MAATRLTVGLELAVRYCDAWSDEQRVHHDTQSINVVFNNKTVSDCS